MSDDLAISKKTGEELFQIHFHHLLEWGWKPEEVDLKKWAEYYKTTLPVINEGLLVFTEQ